MRQPWEIKVVEIKLVNRFVGLGVQPSAGGPCVARNEPWQRRWRMV